MKCDFGQFDHYGDMPREWAVIAGHLDENRQQCEKKAGRPKRVLQLIPGLEVGGLELMVSNLVTHLDSEAFQSSICCFDCLGPLMDQLPLASVNVRLLQRYPGVDWRFPLRLAHALKQAQPDVLHLHNPTALVYGALAGRLAGISSIVYTEHGRDFSLSRQELIAERIASRMVTHIAVLCDKTRDWLVDHVGMPSHKMIKIYNGIDPREFNCVSRDNYILLHQELKISGDQPIVGIIGRLASIKNHVSLLRAMKIVLSTLPKALLLIVGDGPLRDQLEKEASKLALGQSVRFLGTRRDVPCLLNLMDVLVLPSFSEGLALTLIEACASATPVIATDVGGNGEVVLDHENGLLIPRDHQPNVLATAIQDVLNNPAQASEMGVKGRRLFDEHFTVDEMAHNYELLYQADNASGRTMPTHLH